MRYDPFAEEKEAAYQAKKNRAAQMAAKGQIIDSRGFIVAAPVAVAAPVVTAAPVAATPVALRAAAMRMGNRCARCGCRVGAEDFCADCG